MIVNVKKPETIGETLLKPRMFNVASLVLVETNRKNLTKFSI